MPIVLYVKGKLPENFDRCIGVVGTRKPTAYGKDVTESFCRDLASAGLIIVSGMARGVDGMAHRMAIQMGVPTIAVLGCGVDVIYPPEHRQLHGEIIAHGGAIVSEVPPGHTVAPGLFPARNRIISALSRGIVVTEGAEDSGSLITATCAVEQGKEVFAIPGPVTSYLSAGPAKLIKQGAQLVTSANDVLEVFHLQAIPIKTQNLHNGLSESEKKLVALIGAGTVHFDDLVHESSLNPSEVGTLLTMLELNGILRNLGDGTYTIV